LKFLFFSIKRLKARNIYQHPDELIDIRRRVDVKARWCEEEKMMMARKEVELTANGVKHINT